MSKSTFLITFALCGATSPAFSHSIEEKIADCSCDKTCFTAETADLSCSSSKFSFRSNGLPKSDHAKMTGITATNQQFPTAHSFQFSILTNPKLASGKTQTVPGAIGVAVNGVPIFDPGTQGPVDPNSGRTPNAYDEGELDLCGGHAGRGDDYHYHIAPKCLIDQLGQKAIETNRQPIGYAADGFPILALGWFDGDNSIETKLDQCRGATDGTGRYFYNVKNSGDFAVLNCYSGKPQKFAKDDWRPRRDRKGNPIVGIPLKFKIEIYNRDRSAQGVCHSMTGLLSDEQVALTGGTAKRITQQSGSIFYCNSTCYGHFAEASGGWFARGRTIVFEQELSGCDEQFTPAKSNPFSDFQG